MSNKTSGINRTATATDINHCDFKRATVLVVSDDIENQVLQEEGSTVCRQSSERNQNEREKKENKPANVGIRKLSGAGLHKPTEKWKCYIDDKILQDKW
jgi:hypothetical protein